MRTWLLSLLLLAGCSSDPSAVRHDAGAGGADAGGAGAGGGAGTAGAAGAAGTGGGAGASGAAGTGGAAGASGAAGSGGAAGAAGAGAGGAGGAPPLYRGRITLTLDANQQISVQAAFDGADGHPEPCAAGTCRCRYDAAPPCYLNRCEATTTPPTQLTAGNLELRLNDQLVGVATPDGTGYTGTFQAISAVPGASLQIIASGGDVPAFSTGVTTDAPLGLITPTTGSLLPRSAGIPFTWSGSPYVARLEVGEADDAPVSAYCHFGGGNGQGTIPAAVAGELAAGEATVQAVGAGLQELVVGDWAIHVAIVNARLVTPVSVTLQ